MAYRDFKELTGRTASDKILRDKAFNIAKNPKYDGYQRVSSCFSDLSKPSDVVKNDVIKKNLYNAKTKNIEDKIPDIKHFLIKKILVEQLKIRICRIKN